MRPYRTVVVVAVALAGVAVGPITVAQAAVGITRAELNGTQLRLEGGGAAVSHALTVNPGAVKATSDNKGQFKIEVSGYSSPTCKVTVSDGSTTASATLTGCTPSSPPPTNPPPSTPSALNFSPTSMTFAAQNTGVQSPSQTLTVTNATSASVFINGDRFTGDFHGGDNCVGLSIAAGASCTIDVIVIPTSDGALTGSFTMIDTAPNSPQTLTLHGTGAGTGSGPTPLVIRTDGLPCPAAGCDLGAGFAFTAGNFYLKQFLGQGGTQPYNFTASGLPAGTSLSSDGFLTGNLPAPGVYPFTVRIADSAGAVTLVKFTLPTQPIPAPGDPGCQHAPTVSAALSGSPIGGQTPSGQAQEDTSHMTSCGGYGLITVSVKNVGLANGTVLGVYLDGGAIGIITLSGGAGTMKPFVTGQFLRFDSIGVSVGRPPGPANSVGVVGGGPFQ